MGTAQWAFSSKVFKHLALSRLLNWSLLNCLCSCGYVECWAKLGLAWGGVGACSLVNCSSSSFCCEGGEHRGEGKHRPVKDYTSAVSQPQRNLNFNLFVLGWTTSYYWCSQNSWVCRALCWRQTWYHHRDTLGSLMISLPLQPLQPISRSRVMRHFSGLIPAPDLCVWVV